MASTDSELRERSAAGGSNASPSSAQTPQGNEGKRAGGGGGGRGPPADLLTSIVRLLHWGVLQIFQTVFSLNYRASLTRSAMFLLVFVVIHLLGNLTIFGGADWFNWYGYKLATNPLIKFVEYYLLIAGVVHLVCALTATMKKNKHLPPYTWRRLSMNITGATLLGFVLLHLYDVRFAEYFGVEATDTSTGTTRRDLYALVLASLGEPWRAAAYAAGVCAVGLHLWYGWRLVVNVMRVPGPKGNHKPNLMMIGQGAALLVTAGFLAVTAKAVLLGRASA